MENDSTNRTLAAPSTCLNTAAWKRFLAAARPSLRTSDRGMITSIDAPARLNFALLSTKCSSMADIRSSSESRTATTRTSWTTVLSAYLSLKSMVTLPGVLNLTTPLRSSISTVSPTTVRSASSPSLRSGIVLSFFLSDLPNAFSGGTSTANSSPEDASARRSATPGGTGMAWSPMQTSTGLYSTSPSGLAASLSASLPRVVLYTSPSPFIDEV